MAAEGHGRGMGTVCYVRIGVKGLFEACSQWMKQLMREINHSRLWKDKGRKLSIL